MSTTHTAQSKSLKKRTQRGVRKPRREKPKAVGSVQAPSRKRREVSAPIIERDVHGERKPTKTQLCLDLLRQPAGASIEELQAATGWQAHSVRGFLAGAIKKKLGLTLRSEKLEDGCRRYRVRPVEA